MRVLGLLCLLLGIGHVLIFIDTSDWQNLISGLFCISVGIWNWRNWLRAKFMVRSTIAPYNWVRKGHA